MVKVFTPPQPTFNAEGRKVFLAGSIEMGKATEWQKEVIRCAEVAFLSFKGRLSIFNPRRSDWDSTWEQKIENPNFFQQVTWELDRIKESDAVIFFFEPGTQSPISLLELGEVEKHKDILVVCPEGFWRKGNVDIYCQRHNIPQFNDPKDAIIYYISKNFLPIFKNQTT